MAQLPLGVQNGPPWRYFPFSVCFVEKGQLIQYATVDVTIRYPDFLAVLHELTTAVAHNLPDLPVDLEPGEGLSLRDGPWWYRMVHLNEPTRWVRVGDQGYRPLVAPPIVGPWTCLDDYKAFERMCVDFVAGRMQPSSWIECQHQLQKDRDEGRLVEIPFKRNGPIIVDGSQAPPATPALPAQTGLQDSLLVQPLTIPISHSVSTRKAARWNQPRLPRSDPNTSAAGHMDAGMGSHEQDDGFGGLDLELAETGTFMRYPQPMTFPIKGIAGETVVRQPRRPPMGIFQTNRPHHTQHPPASSHDPHFVATLTGAKDDKFVNPARIDRRDVSIVTNPYPDDPPTTDPEPYGEGPGPAVPTSPTASTIDLGSPETSTHFHGPHFGTPFPVTPALYPVNMGNSAFGARHAVQRLDPALEVNQRREPELTRRVLRAYHLRRSMRVWEQHSARAGARLDGEWSSVNSGPADEGNATDHLPSLPQSTESKSATKVDKRRNKQRERYRQLLRESGTTREHEGKTPQGNSVAKERERVRETIERQRAERQKRAERRQSLRGWDVVSQADE